jgi:hypothetical protein
MTPRTYRAQQIAQLSARIESQGTLAPVACESCRRLSTACYISTVSVCCSQCVRRRSTCSLSPDLESLTVLVEMRAVEASIRSAEQDIRSVTSDLEMSAAVRRLLTDFAQHRNLLNSLSQASSLLASLRARLTELSGGSSLLAADDSLGNSSPVGQSYDAAPLLQSSSDSAMLDFSDFSDEVIGDDLNQSLLAER